MSAARPDKPARARRPRTSPAKGGKAPPPSGARKRKPPAAERAGAPPPQPSHTHLAVWPD